MKIQKKTKIEDKIESKKKYLFHKWYIVVAFVFSTLLFLHFFKNLIDLEKSLIIYCICFISIVLLAKFITQTYLWLLSIFKWSNKLFNYNKKNKKNSNIMPIYKEKEKKEAIENKILNYIIDTKVVFISGTVYVGLLIILIRLIPSEVYIVDMEQFINEINTKQLMGDIIYYISAIVLTLFIIMKLEKRVKNEKNTGTVFMDKEKQEEERIEKLRNEIQKNEEMERLGREFFEDVIAPKWYIWLAFLLSISLFVLLSLSADDASIDYTDIEVLAISILLSSLFFMAIVLIGKFLTWINSLSIGQKKIESKIDKIENYILHRWYILFALFFAVTAFITIGDDMSNGVKTFFSFLIFLFCEASGKLITWLLLRLFSIFKR